MKVNLAKLNLIQKLVNARLSKEEMKLVSAKAQEIVSKRLTEEKKT